MAYILMFLILITDIGLRRGTTSLVEDVVDVIEINHFMNAEGQEQLHQIIFYDYSPNLQTYVVRAWRTVKNPPQLPYKQGKQYVIVWNDTRDNNTFRKVYAKSVRETWTDYDPETVNQEYLDRNLRRELTQKEKREPRKPKPTK